MLVSAPAGFGKTTLLTEWLPARPAALADERQAAWLSLDPGDNDPASFWAYVIAASRTVAPGIGESALALLGRAAAAPIETVLTAPLNDLGAVAGEIVLVLDDYHVINARDAQDGMAFLLGHLPASLHVVIASRADPALPLAGMRTRGELAEIRTAGLAEPLSHHARRLQDYVTGWNMRASCLLRYASRCQPESAFTAADERG